MRLVSLLLVAACGGAATPPPPADAPDLAAPVVPIGAEIPDAQPPATVANPTSLLDYMPLTLGGAAATAREGTPDRARATYPHDGVTVQVEAARLTDVATTRKSFEMLGVDARSRSATEEYRGLRVQGNPAQLARRLDPPHRATLTVVAANTYLVTVTVEPASSLDVPLPWAEQLDIGGLTRLAILEHKARTAPP